MKFYIRFTVLLLLLCQTFLVEAHLTDEAKTYLESFSADEATEIIELGDKLSLVALDYEQGTRDLYKIVGDIKSQDRRFIVDAICDFKKASAENRKELLKKVKETGNDPGYIGSGGIVGLRNIVVVLSALPEDQRYNPLGDIINFVEGLTDDEAKAFLATVNTFALSNRWKAMHHFASQKSKKKFKKPQEFVSQILGRYR